MNRNDQANAERAAVPDVVIVLTLPPLACSPNARAHWAAKGRAVSGYREESRLVARSTFNRLRLRDLPWDAATILPKFFHKVRRTRDKDNHAASLKAAYDGLADAGLVENDSGLTPLPPELLIDRDNPRVELWITKRETVA